MNKVFVLEHTYEDESHEDSKLIGVYSSIEQAKSTINKLRKLPGFRTHPDGFNIDEYQLNQDSWDEGFGV